jgi:chromosome segregation ATPase
MLTINNDTSDILARFLSLPPEPYSDLFEVEREREELEDEIETLKSDSEELREELKDAEKMADFDKARINELEAALSDALSWVQETLGGQEKAEVNREYLRLYKIL